MDYDGLATLSLLKIQSGPWGNSGGIHPEMNMHVPQSLQTAMELKYLAAIPHHMISPSTNSPIIKPSQDNLLGLFKLTGDGVLITQIEATHLLSGTQAFNGVLPEPEVRDGKYIRWTGKQIYSIILPTISLSAEPKSDKVPKVIIEYGKLKQGQIDNSVSGKILQAIHSDFGSKEAERYMNDLQTIISRYLVKSGFSVGVSDLVIHPDIIKKNRDAVTNAITEEIDLAKRVHLNILEDITGNLSDVYESRVLAMGTNLDNKVIDNTVKALDYRTNRILFMVTSGAKGNATNIKQMMCCLGQQTIDGGRVPIGFTDRTLPHYPRYENGMESRGFIAHNFLEGLNPMEFFFHAQSGREGLIDTAVKTANSGYLQRRLVKIMEDLKTYHDYTIRDSSNEIIEFIYGNDGFDAVKIESQSTSFKLIKADKLFRDYLFADDEVFDEYMLSKSVAKMKAEPSWRKKLDSYNKAVQMSLDMLHVQMVKFIASIDDVVLYYPVNMKKLVAKTMDVFELDKITTKSELMPTEIIDELEKLIDDCCVNGLRNHVLEILVYDYISPKKLIRDMHITRQAFNYILAEIRLGFRKGRVEAGEMVGPLAAQSIGERSTQLSVLGTEEITLIEQMADGTQSVYSGPIGKYIDSYFESAVESVNYVGSAGDNTNAFINIMRNVSVLTVDPKTEKTNWKPISQISRHPANGGMVKVTTKSQRNITTTLSHSHLKRTPDGIVPVRGDELHVGDRIPVSCVNVTDVPMNESNEIFWDEIISIEVLPDPGELVYDIGVEDNHTFALNSGIFTHNTLNSVDWETDMLLAKNGMPFEIKMGQFIDDLLDKYKASGKTQYIPENRTEYLELDDYIEVPSVDKFGNVSWCQVTAVTRHLPVGDLVKVTTDSGREVSATQQKSFLTWNEETQELVDTNGADLKVGDLVPITYIFPEPEPDKVIKHLDFSKYLPKTEYLYGTEFHKAGELHDADTRTAKMGFWKDNQGKTFTIPYSRLDAFVEAWRGKKMTNTVIEKGYIYPKLTNKSHSKIPERIVLDAEFGFIIGLYLAEGCATDTFWGISNNEECIRQRVINWCEKLSLSYTVRQYKDRTFEDGTTEEYTVKGTTTDVIIHGVFWPRFLKKWVGTGSAFKRVPAEAYVAPLEFVKGLLDGYISGDGCVSLRDGTISATSISKQLLNGVAVLLMRFGIFGRISKHNPRKPEGSRIKTENCLPYYNLYISKGFAYTYADKIGCFHPKKTDRLENITKRNFVVQDTGKYRVTKHIVLDKITHIAHHPSSKEYVYDLTVPKTLNFAVGNQLQCRDTFHQAGVGSVGKVTQGVPRLNEMLMVTKNPKTPSNVIYLKDTDRFDRDRAERIKNNIEQTKIGEILKSDPAFYLEPTNKLDSVLEDDREFMKFYEVFAELNPAFKDIPKNPWVIRLEFDRKEMVNRNISMADIDQILKFTYQEASMMYSDDNSGKLVFRLRMPFETRENVEDDFKYLKNKVAEIKKIIIKGVDNIEQVYLSEPSKDCVIKGKESKGFSKLGEVYETKQEYYMTTDGANLFDLLCRDDVDATRTYSIDPNEMNSIFGIHAAKLIVEQQFRQIMTASSAMTSPRHVSLLVNKMAHSGEFMSVNRHGISKENIGPLAKCSFEKISDELREAALFGDIDRLKGVSANIMVGQIPECGTGTTKIFLDEEMLAEELAKLGVTATDIDTEINTKDIFKEFQQKTCINEDDQVKINLHSHHGDGLSLSEIPDVMVD